jgi:hypothetical protein
MDRDTLTRGTVISKLAFRVILVTLSIHACGSCKREAAPGDSGSMNFIGGIRGSMSIADAAKAIQVPTDQWKLVERTSRETSGFRRRFTHEMFRVSLAHVHDSAGDGLLEFLDNRLVSLRVFPSDMHSFLKASGDAGVRLMDKRNVYMTANIRALRGEDFEGTSFVLWQDVRLVAEWRQLSD